MNVVRKKYSMTKSILFCAQTIYRDISKWNCWFAFFTTVKICRVSYHEFTEFEKEIETSDGLKFKLSNDDLDLPYILFYPSGETTGAKFTFSNNNQKYNFVLTHGGEFLRIDEF